MYNLRYHIASLVGVFLALALGLVLGGLVVQRGAVDRQQGALVDGLREEFATLRAESSLLNEQNQILTSFSADMTTEWITDRLVGKNVLLLAHSGRTDGLSAATEAIRSAGGNPVVVTATDVDFGLSDPDVRSLVSPGSEFTPELVAQVAQRLAKEWALPTRERPVTSDLIDAGALTVEGLEPGMAMFAMVDVAAATRKADSGSLALAVALVEEDVTAIIAETPLSKSGAAEAAAERNLPAFNTLGAETGTYTLIALLTGAEPGFYGAGDGTAAPYPPIPEK